VLLLKKTVCFLLSVCALFAIFGIDARGVRIDEGGWEKFVESLPEGALEDFDGASLKDSESFGKAVSEMSGAEYIVGEILDCLGVELGGALLLFCSLCALLVISAIFTNNGLALGNGALSSAVRFCSSGAIFASVIYTQYRHFENIELFFESIGTLIRAMIPVSASLWAMGGNVVSAGNGSASLYVMLGVCETMFGASVIPVCCVMSVLGLCDAMSDEMRTGRMMAAIRKIYNFFLCIVMTILLSSLAAQTAISAAADGTAARTARLVSGSVIPVLGGSVGETLRTVASGVSYLKNIFGVGGILMIFALLLPVGMSVLLSRVVFLICGGLADMLGCANEARLLDGLGEVYGTMLAVVSSVSVMFVLALCIFMQSVVAVA
jgi:stage III sporulation protein AE